MAQWTMRPRSGLLGNAEQLMENEAVKWQKAPCKMPDGSLIKELGNCYMPYRRANLKHYWQVLLTDR